MMCSLSAWPPEIRTSARTKLPLWTLRWETLPDPLHQRSCSWLRFPSSPIHIAQIISLGYSNNLAISRALMQSSGSIIESRGPGCLSLNHNWGIMWTTHLIEVSVSLCWIGIKFSSHSLLLLLCGFIRTDLRPLAASPGSYFPKGYSHCILCRGIPGSCAMQ